MEARIWNMVSLKAFVFYAWVTFGLGALVYAGKCRLLFQTAFLRFLVPLKHWANMCRVILILRMQSLSSLFDIIFLPVRFAWDKQRRVEIHFILETF